MVSRRALAVFILLAALLAPLGDAGQIDSANLLINGAALEVPGSVDTGADIPAVIQTTFGKKMNEDVPETGLTAVGDLTGPGLDAPVTLTTRPGGKFTLPPLHEQADYTVLNIRLVDSKGNFVQYATPTFTVVHVVGTLGTQVTIHQLTPDDLRSRGITIDSRNYDVYDYNFVFTINGQQVVVPYPVIIDRRTHQAVTLPDPPTFNLPNPSTSGPPPRFQPPNLIGLSLLEDLTSDKSPDDGELPDPDPLDKKKSRPSIPAAVIIPTGFGVLHQFFAVILNVSNNAPAGSSIVLDAVSATISTPTGLRVVKINPPVTIGQAVPIRDASGATLLVAMAQGSADWSLEALRSGTHPVDIDIRATYKAPNQAEVVLHGHTTSTIVVSDPRFQINFVHPQNVRAQEPYTAYAFITNTSPQAQTVRISLESIPACDSGGFNFHLCRTENGNGVTDLTFQPGQTIPVPYKLTPNITGHFYAAAADAPEGISTSISLVMQVQPGDIPLSPATLVLPYYTQFVNPALVDANMPLLGIGYSLATAPLTAQISKFPRLIQNDTYQRAQDLARAGERIFVARHALATDNADEDTEPMFHLALDLLGNVERLDRAAVSSEMREWDQLRMLHPDGRKSGAAMTRELERVTVGNGKSVKAFVDAFAAATSHRTPYFLALAHGAPVSGVNRPYAMTVTGATSRTSMTGVAETPDTAKRTLLYGELTRFNAASATDAGELAIVGRWKESLELSITPAAASFSLDLIYPGTNDGTFIRNSINLSGATPGSPVKVVIDRGNHALNVTGAVPAPIVTDVTQTPLTVTAAAQDLHLDAAGHIVTLLFNRPFTVADQAGLRNLFGLTTAVPTVTPVARKNKPNDPAAPIVIPGAAQQDDGRMINISFDHALSTHATYTISVDPIADAAVPSNLYTSTSIVPRIDNDKPGGVIVGKLLLGDGSGVKNALIQLTANQSLQFDTTLPDGSFLFEFVPRDIDLGISGNYSLLTVVDEKAAALDGVIRTNGEVQHIVLQFLGRGTAKGHVSYSDGTLIANAPVAVGSQVYNEFHRVVTDAHGDYTVTDLPVGTLTFAVQDPKGNVAYATNQIRTAGEVLTQNLVIQKRELAGLGTVRITVKRSDNGLVVPGAHVGVYTQGYSLTDGFADVNGRFEFTKVPAGLVSILAADFSITQESVGVEFDLKPDSVLEQTLTLHVPTPAEQAGYAIVEGDVKRDDPTSPNDPSKEVLIPNAVVQIVGMSPITANAAGHYLIPNVPVTKAGKKVSVFDPETRRGGILYLSGTLNPGVSNNVPFTLRTTTAQGFAKLRVRVYAATGEQVRTYKVILPGYPPKLFTPQPDGTYWLDNVKVPMNADVWAIPTSRGTYGDQTAHASIRADFDGQEPLLELRLPGQGTVKGRILTLQRCPDTNPTCTPSYAPSPGAVSASYLMWDDTEQSLTLQERPPVETDPVTGYSVITKVPIGTVSVATINHPDGYATADTFISFEGDVKPVDLKLAAMGGITGRVVNYDGQTPVGGASLTFAGSVVRMDGITTKPDGSFVIPATAGSQNFRITADATVDGIYRTGFVDGRTPTGGGPVNGLVIVMRQQANVSGHIVDSSGAPISKARYWARELAWPYRSWGSPEDPQLAGTDGGFFINNVFSGGVRITAESPVFQERRGDAQVEIAAELDHKTNVNITVAVGEGTSSISISVVDSSNAYAKVPNAEVTLLNNKGAYDFGSTDANGVIIFEELPAGQTYGIRATSKSVGRSGSVDGIVLASGVPSSVQVALNLTGRVSGTVYDGDESTDVVIKGIPVYLYSSTFSTRATTDSSGAFVFNGVPEGAFTLEAVDIESARKGHNATPLFIDKLFPDRSGIRIDLEKTATINVSVYLPDDHGDSSGIFVPLAGVKVQQGKLYLREQQAAGGPVSFPKLLTNDGFRIDVAELGGQERRLTYDGHIPGGATQLNVPLVLSATGSIKVQVTADDPLLIPNAFVAVSGPRSTTFYTTASGQAQLDDMPLGDYSVYVTSQNLSATASGKLLSRSTPLTLSVRLGSRASIHGYVDAELGGVSASTRVVADVTSSSSPSIHLETRTDTAGHYVFNGLPVASTHVVLTFYGPDDITIGASLPNVTIADGTVGSVLMTRVKLDATKPAIVSVFPANNANSVAPNAQVLVTFTEQLADSSISAGAFQLIATDNATFVTTTVQQMIINGKPTVVITPAAPLRSNTIYRFLAVATAISDTTGNYMKADVAASFTTVDYTEPRITAITPSTAIPIDNGVTFRLKFNKPIDMTSYTAPNGGVAKLEQLAAPNGAVIATIPVALNLDTVDPSLLLLAPTGVAIVPSSFYRITVSGTKDLQTPPNVQAAAQIFEYSSIDHVRPVVTILSPVAAGVSLVAGATYNIKVSIVDDGTTTASKDVQYVDWFTTDGTADTAVARTRLGPDYTYLLLVPRNATSVTLKASATDLSFNTSDVVAFTWSITPNQPPQNLTLTTSTANAYLNGHFNANVTFADEGTLAALNLAVTGQHADGSPYPLLDTAFQPSNNQHATRPDTTAPWSPSPVTFGVNLPNDLKEGTPLHVTVTVTDSENQAATKSTDVNLLVDANPPVIVSLDPKAESVYKFVSGAANTFPIVVKVRDAESGVSRVRLAYNGLDFDMPNRSYDAASATWTFSATGQIVAKNADTRIHILATAYDFHGNATPVSADVIFQSVNDGTIPVAQWLSPLDAAALPANTAVSLTLRVHAVDNVKVEKVVFTSSAFPTQTLTAPTGSGDIYAQVVSFTTPAAGTPFTITATVSDSDPQHDVVLPLSVDPVTFDIANGDAMLTGDTSIEAADVARYTGRTIVVSGNGTDVYFKVPLTLKNLIVMNGGHVGDPDRIKLDLTIKDHLFIDADSSVDMSGKGFLGGHHTSEDASLTNSSDRGMTLGDTTSGHGALDASASYGGVGGEEAGDGLTNPTYGSIKSPADFGSGGAGQPVGSVPGGNGGGAIALHGSTAAGDLSTFVIAGAVRADGESGTNGRWSAGSGGSVLLASRALITGPGSRLSANGGDDDGSDNLARGAGGGRMAVAVSDRLDATDPAALLQVRGGRNLGSETRTTLDGGAGTLFLQRPGAVLGELIVSSFDDRAPSSSHLTRYTPIGSANGALTFDAITVSSRALARFDNAYTVADATKVTHDATSLIVQPTDFPTVSMSTTPAAGADVIQGASITATLNGSSIAGVGRIAFAFTAGTPPPVSFDYSNTIAPTNATLGVAATAATGSATLKAIITDRAGRTAETAVSSFNVIANTAPVITRFDVTPASLQMYAGHTITIDAAASDDIAVTSLDLTTTSGLTITKQTPVVTGSTATRSFSTAVPPTTPGGTSIDLKLSASDNFPGRAATSQTKSVTVLADTNPPAVTITLPAAGDTFDVSSTVTIPIRVVVVDAEVGVSQVWATIGNGAQIPMAADPSVTNGWKVDAPVPAVDGTQTIPKDIVVSATDYSGNSGSSAPRTINIHPVFDPDGATVSWLCPSSGALFPSGYSTKLRAYAAPAMADNGVTSVEFYVGNSTTPVPASAVGSNIYEATVQLPTGSDGTPLPLRVVATTIRGNVTDVRVTATIVTGTTISATTTILNGDTQYDGKTVIITGGTITIAGAHTFTRLAVLDGAAVTHAAVDATSSQRLDLQVTGAVYVSCGGTIDTSGKGYQDAVAGFGRTWPNTTTGGSFQSSAGSHGGEGGHGGEASAAAYGSILDPNEPGGAGGHGGDYAGNQGGGIVRIRGAASITVDGTVAADGLYAGQGGSGAGAGGSIRLDAATIGGAGTIHANGATGGAFNFGGGGGRIALYYQNLLFPRANVAASGGDSTPGGGSAGTIYLGQLNASGAKVGDELRAVNSVVKPAGVTPLPVLGNGTVTTVSGTTITLSGSVPEFIAGSQIDFLDATGQIIGTSLIASRGTNGTSIVLVTAPAAGVVAGTAYRSAWAFDQITILGAEVLQTATVRPALVTTDANGLLRAAEVRGGDFRLRGRLETSLIDVAATTIEYNSLITHAPNTTATVNRLVINAGTMTVDATSRIDASAKGYQGSVNDYGITWPFTTTGGSYQGSAGSHGGEGGHGGSPFAATFGSAFDPNEPGGAGGHGGTYAGNEGGGIVRIKAQTLNLDGAILANGSYAGQSSSGSGAGGSIRIDAGTFTGAGSVRANGADAAPFNFGGGGGRIAVYAASMTLPRANVTALGGTNSGAPGTVLFRTGSQLYGDLVVDNGGRTTSVKTMLTSLGINPITSSNATSVTNANAHFDAPDSFRGINLIFGSDTTKSWPIIANTATAVTVTPDAAFAPPAGGSFRGLYKLDSLKARYAAVETTDLLQLTNAPADVDATASLVSGNIGAPIVDVSKFSFASVGGVQLVAAANAITDPDAPILVTVTNGRTNAVSTFSIASGAPFSLYLYGVQGDPISVRARDAHTFAMQSADVSVGTLPIDSGVASVTFQPSPVAGGAKTIATVTMNTPAPSGGAIIALTTSNASVAPVPATVTVASGATTATFNITTTSVAAQTSVIIGASYIGTSRTGTLTVVHDANGPTVTITQPLPATFTEGQPIPVEATIIDAEVGVKQAAAVIDGVSTPMTLDSARANVWTATVSAPDVDPPSDVPMQLSVIATDFENNQSAPTSVTVNIHPIVDSLAPTLAWQCGNGSMYPADANATFSVKVTPASGDQINTVSITITRPSGPQTFPMALAGGNYQYTYAVPSAADGTVFPLRVVATTFGGKTNSVSGTLTIIGGTAVTFPFASGGTISATDTQYENGIIIVTGGTLTIIGPHHFARLAVLNTAKVTQKAADATSAYGLNVQTPSVYVACGASIDVSSTGYGANTTYPGATVPANLNGGSHIGIGGVDSGTAGSTYGSVYQPAEAGSGAGGGGKGGGIVRIDAGTTGTVVVDGSIKANGNDAGVENNIGGAGGSVWITTGTVGGSGNISAFGGDTGSWGTGGGGAVSIEYKTAGNGTVLSHLTARSSASSSRGELGGAGSIYLKGPGGTFGEMTIDNAGITGQPTNLPSLGSGFAQSGSGGAVLVTDRATNIPEYFQQHWIEIREAGGNLRGTWRASIDQVNRKQVTLQPNAGETISVQAGDRWQGVYRFDTIRALNGETFNSVDPIRLGANGDLKLSGPAAAGRYLTLKDPIDIATVTIVAGNVAATSITATNTTIKSGAVLAAPPPLPLTINSTNVTVESGASIDVSNDGYGANTTYTGATAPANQNGGSHIGIGGIDGGTPGSTYGSVYRPAEAGSGGGGGGKGGGAVAINAGTLQIDGSIKANGNAANTENNIGGAGGSVWIITSNITGSGTIDANGGDTGSWGTGGGGAISLRYSTVGSGTILSHLTARSAASSSRGEFGGAGSIYLHGPSSVYGDLVINNAGIAGQRTDLPSFGSGTAQAGSTGAALVTDRAANVPLYFKDHWVQIRTAGGTLKGTWRIDSVDGLNPKKVILKPNGSETMDLQPGDVWRGVYRFDHVTVTGASLSTVDLLESSNAPQLFSGATIVGNNQGAPVVVPAKITLSSGALGPAVTGTAGAVADADQPITVFAQNTNTGQSFTAVAAADGSFSISPRGSIGDSISVFARDGNVFPLQSQPFVVGTLPSSNVTPVSMPITSTMTHNDANFRARRLAFDGNALVVQSYPSGPDSNKLLLFDLSTGSPAWVQTMDVPANTRDVAVRNGVAYVAGSSLYAYDLSVNPATRQQAGVSCGDSYSVAVDGVYAYVGSACNDGRINIYDISSPKAPVSLRNQVTTGVSGTYRQLIPYGDYLIGIVPDGGASAADVVMIDRRDINNLAKLWTTNIAGFSGFRGSLQGTTLYVSSLEGSVAVIDVSVPTLGVLKSVFPAASSAHGITAVGSLAFLAGDTAGVIGVNAADPANPAVAGGVATTPQAAWDVVIRGQLGIIAAEDRLVTFTASVQPQVNASKISMSYDGHLVTVHGAPAAILGGAPLTAEVRNDVTNVKVSGVTVEADGSFTATLAGASGDAISIVVTDASGAKSAVVQVGVIPFGASASFAPITVAMAGSDTSFRARHMAIEGTTLGVVNYPTGGTDSNKLLVFDISGSAPALSQRIDVPANTRDVAIRNNVAYVPGSSFYAYDLSVNPAVRQQASVSCSESYSVAVDGAYAYVGSACNDGRINIYDVTNPKVPVSLRNQITAGVTGTYRQLIPYGNYLIGITPDGGAGIDVVVIDRRDINNLVKVSTIAIPGIFGFRGTVAGQRLYVAGEGTNAAMAVVDLTNVASPTFVVVPTVGGSRGVAVAGNLAAFGDGSPGVTFFDVTNPSAPRLIGTQNVGGTSWDVLFAGGKLYAAAEQGIAVISGVVAPPVIDVARISIVRGTTVTVSGSAGAIFGAATPITAQIKNETSNVTVSGVTVAADGSFSATIAGTSGDAISLVATDANGAKSTVAQLGVVPFGVSAAFAPITVAMAGNDTNFRARHMAIEGTTLAVVTYPIGSTDTNKLLIFDISGATPVLTQKMDVPANTRDVAIRNNVAYVPGSSFYAYDLSVNPATRQQAGVSCSESYSVAVDGAYAYVGSACNDGRINIYDVTNPKAPISLRNQVTAGVTGTYRQLIPYGNYLIGITSDGGAGIDVVVIDRRDINNLVKVSATAIPGIVGFRGAVSGQRLYVAGEGTNTAMAVVDLSNLASPTFVVVPTVGGSRGVAVAGNLAAFGDGSPGVTFFDVTNPSAPRLIGTQNVGGMSWDVLFAGGKLYAAAEQGIAVISGVVAPPIVDVSRITIARGAAVTVSGSAGAITGASTPITLQMKNETSNATVSGVTVAANGSFSAAIAGTSGDVISLIATNADSAANAINLGIVPFGTVVQAPTQVLASDNNFRARHLAIEGTTLAVVTYPTGGTDTNKLLIFDISGATPVLTQKMDVPANTRDVAIRNNVAYVPGSSFYAYDLSLNPATRQQAGVSCSESYSVAVDGAYAYVGSACNDGRINIYDITNPKVPVSLRNQGTGITGTYRQLIPYGNYLIGITSDGGAIDVVVIDRHDVNNLVKVSATAIPNIVGFRGAVSGQKLYVAGEGTNTTMAVVDLSDVAAPTFAVVPTVGGSRGVAVAGNLAAFGDGTSGVTFFDVTNPSAPRLIGTQNVGGMSWDVLFAGGKLYAASEQMINVVDLSGAGGFFAIAPPVESFHAPVPPPEPRTLRVDRARISIDESHGVIVVRGARGALAGPRPITIEVRNATLGTSVPVVPVSDDGSFETTIGAAPGDHLFLEITSGAGEQIEIDLGPPTS